MRNERIGRWKTHTISAPTTTKIPTTMWHNTAHASSTAGSQRRRRVRSEYARAPRNPIPNVSASENEYSPASALTIGPPMIRWLNWIVASWVPGAPATPLKNRKSVVVSANSSGPGRRTLSPRPRPYAAAGIRTRPSAVTTLNATLYGMTTPSTTVMTAGSGK